MTPTEPLPLYHSWPLSEADHHFDLGRLHDSDDAMPVAATGRWACDLVDDRLHWSAEVMRLFGFDPEAPAPNRGRTVSLYDEPSRAAMERLRAYAIRHCRGFTLDIRIAPVEGAMRWLRLIAAPVRDGDRVIRLHGSKTDVSHLYPRTRG